MQGVERSSVSVILPVFNRAVQVRRAIESVLKQTFDDWSLVIVDDCSTDDTYSVASSFADRRIEVLRTPRNSGAAAARNLGIAHSKSVLVSFLDSDDEYQPGFLTESLNKFTKVLPNVGLLWTGLRYIRRRKGREVIEEYLWKPIAKANSYSTFLADLRIGTNSGITIRRAVFDDVGLFDERLPASEDTDLFLRISQKFSFDFVEHYLINIYQTGDDRLSKRFDKIAVAYNLIIPKHLRAIEQEKALRLKYFYKAMWLNYHLGNFTQARYYFRLLKEDKWVNPKAWLIAFLFEVFGNGHGARIHTWLSE